MIYYNRTEVKVKAMISVIMPVYNAKKFIEKAIYSILNQTEKDFELILIDDCGTDGSMEIASSILDPRIKVLRNEKNMGIAYSRNKALEFASGEYIACMDHDDLAPINRLELSKKFLDENKDIEVVGGSFIKIDENDKPISFSKRIFSNPERIKSEIMFRNMFANGSTMYRKDFVVKNNLKYHDNCLGMEDYKFWLECSHIGKMANLPNVFLYMRKHSSNETLKNMNEKTEERTKLFNEMRLVAFERNGFKLNDKDKQIFCRSFDELQNKPLNQQELKDVLDFLKEVIRQATEMQLENLQQIIYICHDMYALKTRTADIWK